MISRYKNVAESMIDLVMKYMEDSVPKPNYSGQIFMTGLVVFISLIVGLSAMRHGTDVVNCVMLVLMGILLVVGHRFSMKAYAMKKYRHVLILSTARCVQCIIQNNEEKLAKLINEARSIAMSDIDT